MSGPEVQFQSFFANAVGVFGICDFACNSHAINNIEFIYFLVQKSLMGIDLFQSFGSTNSFPEGTISLHTHV